MTYKADFSFTRVNGDTKILAYHDEDAQCWEVYYKRQDFPFMFAFGLPGFEPSDNVYHIAVCNIENFNNLFKEVKA